MEFDKRRVYTALNAEELKIGSKVIVADTLDALKHYVAIEADINILIDIKTELYMSRFVIKSSRSAYEESAYVLAYLVSEPEEKKLKWTDLKIGDVIRKKYEDGYRYATIIRIDTYSTNKHIGLEGEWLTNEYLEEWEKVEE